MAALKLLIVEDDIASLELMAEVFTSLKAEVRPLNDSQKAARLVNEEKFDGIFLDLEMPNVHGFDLARRIRNSSWNKTTPIIIVTGRDERETMQQAFALGAAAWANTAKTKVETANLGEQPIFAVDPATNERVMTTRPEAQAKGYTNPVAVKEGDVSKETDARAMINDVQLNKSRYLAAMQQVYSQPMTNAQKSALVALTPEKLGVDFGSLFKLEMPDVMQKVANASAFSVLSPQQKQAVVGYYSTLASVPAAQKALTNIGRSNKEMMDLELRTIPTPIMDEGTFGTMLDRFQGNIDQTSRKTVRMPGMPSTSDIRNLYEGGQQSPQPGRQPNGPAVNFNMPRPMNTVPLWSLVKSQGQ